MAWRSVTIAELTTRTSSGGTPSRKRPEFFADGQDGIPWVRSQELVDRRISGVGEHITDEGLRQSSAKLFPPSTVLVAMYGATVGQLGYLDIEAATNQAICALITDPDVTDPRFLYYAIMGVRHDLVSQAQGAAQQNLSQAQIRDFSLQVPDIATQRMLADVLGSLDDLIENNRRRIELLEEMAQAIYREWFVHFRFPGHEDATFVDSPLGPIPDGWEVRSLSDLCSRIQAGGTPKRSEPAFWSDGTVDWYKTGDLTDSILIRSSEQITEHAVASSSTRTFEPETILMAIYGSPTVGRLGLVETTSSANQAALGLIADPSVSSTAHLWFALRELREPLNRIAQGAAQQNVSKQKVADAQVISAPSEVINHFTVSAGVPWRLGHRLAHANAGLAGLRDLLLPKLVTGEIDVSDLDLDALVEAAS